MKEIRDKYFIDTNIFVYAKLNIDDEYKHLSAKEFLAAISAEVITSTQVLGEFYNVLSRYKIDDEFIQTAIIDLLKYSKVRVITLNTIKF